MRRSLAASAVLLMCALGACSSGGGSDDSGSGGESTSKPDSGDKSSASFNPCKEITPAEVEAILGYPVVVEETPSGGCSWGSEENPRLASFSVGEGTPAEQGGGIESSKIGTQSVLEGELQDISGVGDAAYLVVGKGKAFATTQFQAAGVIEADGQLIAVGITQLGDAPEDEVQKQADAGMKLVGSKF